MTHKCTLCVSTLLTPVRPASSREQTSEVIFIVCFANIISVVIICLVWTFETRIVSTSWYDLYVCVRVRTSSYLIRSSFFDKKKKKNIPSTFVDRNRADFRPISAPMTRVLSTISLSVEYAARTCAPRARRVYVYMYNVSFYFWLIAKTRES